MEFRNGLFRYMLVITLLLVSIQGVSGWTLTGWSVSPATPQLDPGTDVTVKYTLHFDSWMTGTTFDSAHTLMMTTSLADPGWIMVKSEVVEENQPPVTEPMGTKKGAVARLDGWTLSYSGKQFDIAVTLTGKTPTPPQSGKVTLVQFQEKTASAELVGDSAIKKEVLVVVPTPVPVIATAAPTINMTPAEVIVITPEPSIPVTTAVPTRKVTYSPGPEPVVVVGLLAGLVCIMAVLRRRE